MRFNPLVLISTLLVVAISLCMVGCGGDGKYPVSGSVTWEGETIPADQNGYVTFTPVDDSVGPDAGPIGPNGKYSFRSSPGEKKVEIMISRPVGKVVESMGMAAQEQYIPRKYNEETELSVTIEPKSNELDFDLVK